MVFANVRKLFGTKYDNAVTSSGKKVGRLEVFTQLKLNRGYSVVLSSGIRTINSVICARRTRFGTVVALKWLSGIFQSLSRSALFFQAWIFECPKRSGWA